MERVNTTGKWKRALIATLCAFTLAFSMVGVAWADLAVGTQSSPGDSDYIDTTTGSYKDAETSGDDSAIVFKLYKQEVNGSAELVKEYKKSDIDALATNGNLAYTFGGSSWSVAVTTSYVRLDDMFADAGVADLWRSGSYFDLPQNGKYTDGYAYEDFIKAKYYPNSLNTSFDLDGAVAVPMVLAIKSCTASIGAANLTDKKPEIDATKTAAQTITALDMTNSTNQTTDSALRFLGGISEDNATAGIKSAGNRLWSNVSVMTLVYDDSEEPTIGESEMHRLYNPNSGEHFFTSSDVERDNLVEAGWDSEEDGWTAPQYSDTPVYRLYNANGGEHHYTTSETEVTSLVRAGWNYEGIGWYSDDAEGVKIYRVYNPNAFSNNHHYTTSEAESENLISAGWRDEGVGFYGVAA